MINNREKDTQASNIIKFWSLGISGVETKAISGATVPEPEGILSLFLSLFKSVFYQYQLISCSSWWSLWIWSWYSNIWNPSCRMYAKNYLEPLELGLKELLNADLRLTEGKNRGHN